MAETLARSSALAQDVASSQVAKPAASADVRSHFVYDGSEAWCNVPEPRLPSDHDPSGLGLPGPTAIAGYVYWTRGERGPKTRLQAYADNISALMLSVHPLEIVDCKAPSAAEVDRMRVRNALVAADSVPRHVVTPHTPVCACAQVPLSIRWQTIADMCGPFCVQKHQALQLADTARAPAVFTVPLAKVLNVTLKLVAYFAVRRQLRHMRNAPMVYIQPVMLGFFAGLILRWRISRRRCAFTTDPRRCA